MNNSPVKDQVSQLGQITETISVAKDKLDQAYLKHKDKADVNVVFLQNQLKTLFKGTDSPPVEEEEITR